MDFSLSPKAFLSQQFDLNKLSAREKFLAVSSALSGGDSKLEVTLVSVKKIWTKKLLKIAYDHSYYSQAQAEGWVNSAGRGKLTITDKGFDYLEGVAANKAPGIGAKGVTKLALFQVGKTHTFDKFLRSVFSQATQEVKIADSYVDETIFDNLLDQIPDSVGINLLYRKKQGTFDIRVPRFSIQYTKFVVKQFAQLHDRFMIIDGVGYVIGPSLKDAARKSPALVVELNMVDSKQLEQFFDTLWAQEI